MRWAGPRRVTGIARDWAERGGGNRLSVRLQIDYLFGREEMTDAKEVSYSRATGGEDGPSRDIGTSPTPQRAASMDRGGR